VNQAANKQLEIPAYTEGSCVFLSECISAWVCVKAASKARLSSGMTLLIVPTDTRVCAVAGALCNDVQRRSAA